MDDTTSISAAPVPVNPVMPAAVNPVVPVNPLMRPHIIETIYHLIVRAGKQACKKARQQSLFSEYLTVPVGAPSRYPATLHSFTGALPLMYRTLDLTVIGGCAIALQSTIKEDLKDMDIVWWPMLPSPPFAHLVFTADSPAIRQFVRYVEEQIQDQLRTFPIHLIPGLTHLSVHTVSRPRIGVHTLYLTFHGQGMPLQPLVELAIHDNGGSQHYNIDGTVCQTVPFMMYDPVYCTSDHGLLYSSYAVHRSHAYTPNRVWLLQQQVFLYQNLVRTGIYSIEKRDKIARRILQLESALDDIPKSSIQLQMQSILQRQIALLFPSIAEEYSMNEQIQQWMETSREILSMQLLPLALPLALPLFEPLLSLPFTSLLRTARADINRAIRLYNHAIRHIHHIHQTPLSDLLATAHRALIEKKQRIRMAAFSEHPLQLDRAVMDFLWGVMDALLQCNPSALPFSPKNTPPMDHPDSAECT